MENYSSPITLITPITLKFPFCPSLHFLPFLSQFSIFNFQFHLIDFIHLCIVRNTERFD